MAPNLSWGGFQNGKIPYANLVQFQTGKYLQADAAASLRRLCNAFLARWGGALYADWYQDLYRDYARQQDMWNHRGDGFPWPDAVASPGNSIHGWARSADLTGYGAGGSTRHNWLVATAPSYGWSWDYGRALGEAWHFDYVGPITTTAGGDTSPLATRKKDMTTLYHKQGSSPTLYALAGDSPGTSANWLETSTATLATSWAAAHGNSSLLSAGTWDLWKAAYLEPLSTAGSGSGGLTAAQNDALMGLPAAVDDLPTKGELTQALTSTVSLVNEHADDNKEEIIAAIPSSSSGGSASAYALSLEIEQVPGTATGTATPQ